MLPFGQRKDFCWLLEQPIYMVAPLTSMKYIKPSMVVVRLQHQSIICQSVRDAKGIR